MNWLDILILLFLGIYLIAGYRRGFMGQLFGMAGIVLALVLAFSFFGPVGMVLSRLFPVGPEIGGVIGFVLIVVTVTGLFAYAAVKWRKLEKSTAVSQADSIAGAFFGGLKALLILVVVTVILILLPIPPLRAQVEDSPLAVLILRTVPVVNLLQEKSLPVKVPRLLVTNQGIRLVRLDMSSLDGATCLACRQKVNYTGMVRKGLFCYDRFVCTNPKCGLVSDGCLTFEGYHMLKGECPLKKANQGEGINCEVWPNAKTAFPHGPCPVCGAR